MRVLGLLHGFLLVVVTIPQGSRADETGIPSGSAGAEIASHGDSLTPGLAWVPTTGPGNPGRWDDTAGRVDGAGGGPDPGQTGLPPGIGPVIVHSQFGGQIFGFDIDQGGTEGLLSEAQDLDNGNVLAAVETFDQHSGRILRVVAMSETQDDFLTLGVVGGSVGLIEFEHEISFLHLQRSFYGLNPLTSNRFTQKWIPPIDADHLIEKVSRSQGIQDAAVYASDNSESFRPVVFSSNVASSTFGPTIPITDRNFSTGLVPALAYNSTTKQAVLGIQTFDEPFVPPTIALVDLTNGASTIFSGVGTGNVDGIAVDSNTNIACTTTEIDFSVQFYDLAVQTGFSQFLPGANSQFFSGADVAVDPVHRLFLVAQPNSSTAPGTSSIHVYDEQGNLIESIDGFHFSNTFNVVPMHIALHPSQRFGYVDGPGPGVTEIQAFRY